MWVKMGTSGMGTKYQFTCVFLICHKRKCVATLIALLGSHFEKHFFCYVTVLRTRLETRCFKSHSSTIELNRFSLLNLSIRSIPASQHEYGFIFHCCDNNETLWNALQMRQSQPLYCKCNVNSDMEDDQGVSFIKQSRNLPKSERTTQ